MPAKRRLDVVSEQVPKRRKQVNHASPPQSDQLQAPLVSTQETAAALSTPALTGPKPSEFASPLSTAEESAIRPRPRSYSATKGKSLGMIIVLLTLFDSLESRTRPFLDRFLLLTTFLLIEQPSRRKGVGLYAGNWEYAPDEERQPEYQKIFEKIADVEGRTTRRAFAKLASNDSPRDSNTTVHSPFDNQVRKSGRARTSINYAQLSTAEDNTHETATPEQTLQNDMPSAQPTNQMSTSALSSADRSTMMLGDHSSSSSMSPGVNVEQLERPKLSWNAIVYEVLATAKGPLTFTELTQEIKNRYPFFNASSQDKVLKSGLKNPLYFHEAFCKGEIINGKQTWGLKPGEFVDKKTGEVLTPQPRNPIVPPGLTEQVHETEAPSAVALTTKVSPTHHPRSSNPRFGREILNSPEIPDSQDVAPTTSSPQGPDRLIAPERPLHFEELTEANKPADAASITSVIALPKAHVPTQAPQTLSQLKSAMGLVDFTDLASLKEIPDAGMTEDEMIRKFRKFQGQIDREASAIAAHSISPLQAAEPRAPSIPSSTGESANHNSPTNSQYVSPPTLLERAVSPSSVPTFPRDDAATSQAPQFVPATPTPSQTQFMYVILSSNVTSSPMTPIKLISSPSSHVFAQDGKAVAKENAYGQMPRWA